MPGQGKAGYKHTESEVCWVKAVVTQLHPPPGVCSPLTCQRPLLTLPKVANNSLSHMNLPEYSLPLPKKVKVKEALRMGEGGGGEWHGALPKPYLLILTFHMAKTVVPKLPWVPQDQILPRVWDREQR